MYRDVSAFSGNAITAYASLLFLIRYRIGSTVAIAMKQPIAQSFGITSRL